MFEKHQRYQRLIATAQSLERMITAVAHLCDQSSLEGAINAAEMGLIRPILIGPQVKIAGVAQEFQLDIAPYECVDVPHSTSRADSLIARLASCAVAAPVAAARRQDASKVIA